MSIGEFTLASGIRSDYYVDARKCTFSGAGQLALGWIGFDLVRSLSPVPKLVGGLTLGADPIACAIAHRCVAEGLEIDAFTVRKESKGHGLGRRIEGPVARGMRALVVEDCVTTGRSSLKAVHALREAGLIVDCVLTLVDRSVGRGAERLHSEGLTLVSLFSGPELARLAAG